VFALADHTGPFIEAGWRLCLRRQTILDHSRRRRNIDDGHSIQVELTIPYFYPIGHNPHSRLYPLRLAMAMVTGPPGRHCQTRSWQLVHQCLQTILLPKVFPGGSASSTALGQSEVVGHVNFLGESFQLLETLTPTST
jgi:hypothetical protein